MPLGNGNNVSAVDEKKNGPQDATLWHMALSCTVCEMLVNYCRWDVHLWAFVIQTVRLHKQIRRILLYFVKILHNKVSTFFDKAKAFKISDRELRLPQFPGISDRE